MDSESKETNETESTTVNKKEKCNHVWEYNDETMGGFQSWWYKRCVNCDYFEKE